MKAGTICLLIVGGIFLAFMYILLSLNSIEPLEYGITYNRFTKSIGSDVYESGRYILSPITTFFTYPANLITIEFSDRKEATGEPLQTRTAEGLALVLHVSFQYQVNKEKLSNLYNLATVLYHETYVRISRDIILKIAGSYEATDYWLNRRAIGEKMKTALDESLSTAFANCWSLQIMQVDLPKSYEDSIVATQVEVQKTNMRKFEQEAELIRQNISVYASEANQKIKVINATAVGESYRLKQFAQAKALNNTLATQAESYKLMEKEIGLDNKELLDYIYLNSLRSQPDSRILVGLSNAIIGFGGNQNQPVYNPNSNR
jgi:hypothetical protein